MASILGSARTRAVLVGLVILVSVLSWWWSKTPQLGEDEEVTKTVDALFTAVTAQDQRRLGQCEQRLHVYRGEGRLPADASTYLDGIITVAREGHWKAAAERLYRFVRAQRREGGHVPVSAKPM